MQPGCFFANFVVIEKEIFDIIPTFDFRNIRKDSAMLRSWFKKFFGNGIVRDSGKLVLVVDDGESERTLMTRTLTRNGYRVICAVNGEDGVRLARESKPDLIYLDFNMPGGIDGQEACRQIKGNEVNKDTPIVFLSGSMIPTKVIDCYDVGAEYFLSKPIEAKVLLQHTRQLLQDADFTRNQVG